MKRRPSNEPLDIPKNQAQGILRAITLEWDRKPAGDPDRDIVTQVCGRLEVQPSITPDSLEAALRDVLGAMHRKIPKTRFGDLPGGGYGPIMIPGTGHQEADDYYALFYTRLFKQPAPILDGRVQFLPMPHAPEVEHEGEAQLNWAGEIRERAAVSASVSPSFNKQLMNTLKARLADVRCFDTLPEATRTTLFGMKPPARYKPIADTLAWINRERAPKTLSAVHHYAADAIFELTRSAMMTRDGRTESALKELSPCFLAIIDECYTAVQAQAEGHSSAAARDPALDRIATHAAEARGV
jgi:hypothetical protein